MGSVTWLDPPWLALRFPGTVKRMCPQPQVVNYKVQLSGEPEELRALEKLSEKLAPAMRVRVWREDDVYWLHAPQFDSMTDAMAILKRGEALIGRLNGLGVLKFGGFRPVRAVAVSRASPAEHYAAGALDLPSTELRAYLDYTPNRPAVMNAIVGPIYDSLPLVEEWTNVPAKHVQDIDDALQLFALALRPEDWRLLYVVYEIVEDVLGAKDMAGLSARKNQIKLFKHTANSRGALGTRARHGHRRQVAPKKAMTFSQASALIRSVLLEALQTLGR